MMACDGRRDMRWEGLCCSTGVRVLGGGGGVGRGGTITCQSAPSDAQDRLMAWSVKEPHPTPRAPRLALHPCLAVRFTQGKPFRPFEQLMAVLPAASASLLPPPLQRLMLDPSSPIRDFYPDDFEVDMEGKRAAWEGVVLIAFVEEVGSMFYSCSTGQPAKGLRERVTTRCSSCLIVKRYARVCGFMSVARARGCHPTMRRVKMWRAPSTEPIACKSAHILILCMIVPPIFLRNGCWKLWRSWATAV